ncbi:MAG: hypothetical protein H7843_01845 [Nitrospirota bacterium]
MQRFIIWSPGANQVLTWHLTKAAIAYYTNCNNHYQRGGCNAKKISSQEKDRARNKFFKMVDDIRATTKDIPFEEIESAIDEAIKAVRLDEKEKHNMLRVVLDANISTMLTAESLLRFNMS